MTHKVYLGLGSNLGNRESNINRAIQLIEERVGLVSRRSSLIETKPWGFESNHSFLNAVVLCHTEKTPREVLMLTQRIERELGRKSKTTRQYADRPIDIDILLYDDLTVDDPDLKIPHPLMRERDFVMIPLREIYNN
ncbi:MAG: 2-amino-4-hydroxy-6-hydroxymethyldihydropteridine diphosphokinase [Prevotella sp.]|nr:2-amino-4-hydroxy-6-hydroxymethyldihydropteridine diphosphokinase [Prevotella sp.]